MRTQKQINKIEWIKIVGWMWRWRMMQQPVVFSFTIFDLVLERTFCSTLNCNAMQETCCSDCLWLKMLTFYYFVLKGFRFPLLSSALSRVHCQICDSITSDVTAEGAYCVNFTICIWLIHIIKIICNWVITAIEANLIIEIPRPRSFSNSYEWPPPSLK